MSRSCVHAPSQPSTRIKSTCNQPHLGKVEVALLLQRVDAQLHLIHLAGEVEDLLLHALLLPAGRGCRANRCSGRGARCRWSSCPHRCTCSGAGRRRRGPCDTNRDGTQQRRRRSSGTSSPCLGIVHLSGGVSVPELLDPLEELEIVPALAASGRTSGSAGMLEYALHLASHQPLDGDGLCRSSYQRRLCTQRTRRRTLSILFRLKASCRTL